MKKILSLILGLSSMWSYSQIDGKNEIKANIPYALAGFPEISYERLIDNTASVGISAAYSFQTIEKIPWPWIITPYYRLYFGGDETKPKAASFFVEANAIAAKQYVTKDVYGSMEPKGTGYYINFGCGAAMGIKVLTKQGVFFEFFGGASRVFNVDSSTNMREFFPRAGINCGKRF